MTADPAGDAPVRHFQVTIDGQDHRVALIDGQTLLQAALAAGIDAPHTCTEGRCGSCMAHLKSGAVTMAETRALSKRNREKGNILSCQARPSSSEPLWIDYDL